MEFFSIWNSFRIFFYFEHLWNFFLFGTSVELFLFGIFFFLENLWNFFLFGTSLELFLIWKTSGIWLQYSVYLCICFYLEFFLFGTSSLNSWIPYLEHLLNLVSIFGTSLELFLFGIAFYLEHLWNCFLIGTSLDFFFYLKLLWNCFLSGTSLEFLSILNIFEIVF